ncbi:cell division cycle 7-related protein kinase [Phtheirospermum japonicum]|uniref:non-specific serine/threonine protein kinase n=1 Tax=Phtheirospermum japonicum TaxID=374723 RepID=A0A830CTV0_9LAMI|nr:cell division cycle 7-related protein kinase [Phtheirospermum japonicum]
MEAPPSNSELDLQLSTTRFSTTAAAAAWHVLGLLLSYGRPALTSELATIFDSTPEFIRFLCSIPNSPLRFADNHFVTFSPAGVANIANFCSHSDVVIRYLDLPQIVPRLLAHFRSNEIVMSPYCRKRKRPTLDIEDFPLVKKKNHFIEFNDEDSLNQLTTLMPDRFQNVFTQGIGTPSSSSSILEYDSAKLEKIIFGPAMFTKSSFEHVSNETENVEHENHEMEVKHPNREGLDYLYRQSCKSYSLSEGRLPQIHKVGAEVPLSQLSLPPHIMESSEGSKFGGIDIVNPINSFKLEVDERMIVSHEENEAAVQGCESLKTKDVNGKGKEVWSRDSGRHRGHKENQLMDIPFTDRSHVDKPEKTLGEANDEALFPVRPRTEGHLPSQGDMLNINRYSSITKPDHNETRDIKKAICPTMENGKLLPYEGLQQGKRHKNLTTEKQQMKLNCELNMNKVKRELFKEKGKKASSTFKNHIEQKSFPDFESFIVEEEEGSGGYGTVYRARRKSDGVTFAIKSPHDNANRNYVINEMKMLERLRGKNFVIRYEGSFKSGSADCLVLEHVEHDRPETLKREIDIIHLQWYGYCLFKALAGLHKQGIVHRDVKPGNFLYSRKANKGYLIDFNLALDLHKKHGTVDNSKARHTLNDSVRVPQTSSIPPAKNKKIMNTRFSGVKGNPGKASTSVLPPGNLKKKVDKAKVLNDASRNIIKSQGGDGSGITSAKDGTSNKTQSAERFREPIPSQGRRELLSLVQEARQGGHYESVTAPISKRKRVAASPGDTETFFVHPTPMPLHASGIGIRGAGLLKSKGDGKPRREGPCAGTKGFKAPEVLFRSLHQGPKADVWSAGVTLLYMMIGRAPFIGDTDQNIKEIAKLRGSEDLWEVAKLHNHESLFPTDLLDVKYLSPTKLRDWCAQNTRRPDFLEAMPRSLFDLVDKCLMVNQRHRISAEEALVHEFFWPCHDILRKSKAAKARDIK